MMKKHRGTDKHTNLLSSVAIAVLLAVGATAPAYAAPAKAATQQEIDDLRQQMQMLKDRLDQLNQANQQSQAEAQKAQSDAADAKVQAARSAANAEAAKVQAEDAVASGSGSGSKDGKIHYKGVTLTMGGFLEAAGIYRQKAQTADMGSSYNSIPFANDPAGHTRETRFSSRQSRYSLLAEGAVDSNTVASFYGEFDFLGAAQTANSKESNSYQPRVRNLYGTVDWNDSGWHLLAGQNWSLVTLQGKGITPRTELSPAVIEAQYVPGFAWARQPGVRIVKDFDRELWLGLSVEQGQTTFGNTIGLGGVTVTATQLPTSQFYNGTAYSLNSVPDVIGKVVWDKKLGDQRLHVEGFGLYREFQARVNVIPGNTYGLTPGNTTSTTRGGGGGVSVVLYDLVPKVLDLQASYMGGSGIGRYGSAQLPDVTNKPDGSLAGIRENMWLVGATVHAGSDWDIYAYGGAENQSSKTFANAVYIGAITGYGTGVSPSNAGCQIEGGACAPYTKGVNQFTTGFWWKFYQGSFGRVQWGIQYSHTDRNTFADLNGIAPSAKENMVFTSLRFYPF